MKKNAVLGSLIAALLAGTVGGVGYKVIRDTQADVFEDSVHQVVRVIDGDTIDLENDVRVRLLGIDTPRATTALVPKLPVTSRCY